VHVPATHVPDALQVSVSVPQSPHAAGVVWPGAQTPLQAPLTQVWLLHATGLPNWPLESHVSTPLPEHCVAPGVQTPAHAPLMQT
jgi:hypothetical protein